MKKDRKPDTSAVIDFCDKHTYRQTDMATDPAQRAESVKIK